MTLSSQHDQHLKPGLEWIPDALHQLEEKNLIQNAENLEDLEDLRKIVRRHIDDNILTKSSERAGIGASVSQERLEQIKGLGYLN